MKTAEGSVKAENAAAQEERSMDVR